MKKSYALLLVILLSYGLIGCENQPTAQAQQYEDGKFESALNITQMQLPTPVNMSDYLQQITLIKETSPSLYANYYAIYDRLNQWLENGAVTKNLNQFDLSGYQLAGVDDWGNVHLTGYYTPVLKARHVADAQYRYPLYAMPVNWPNALPSRSEIYNGALSGLGLELAYTRSLMDNFIMEVQGSGYIDFEDGKPLTFFSYRGKNGQSYQSIGRLLIERGEIEREKISMQAIKAWANQQSDETVLDLLAQNASFVFFHPKENAPVIGATGIPLIAKASVASDRSLIPSGSVLLVEVPLLDENGQFNGQRELRLMVALDIGSAIKGQHFDIYQGIGDEAGELAGFYNHYGRAWLIKRAND